MRFSAPPTTSGVQDMSLGTILSSVAALVFVAAYVARPFRRERVDVDLVVDRWVRQVQRSIGAGDDASEPVGVDVDATVQREADPSVDDLSSDAGASESAAEAVELDLDQDEPVNFCPYCGRRVVPDHVFCPKCGRQLAEGVLG